MSTGDTLATLIEEVQYEVGQVASPAAGQNFREHIKARIRREYRRLYSDNNWRDLRRWGADTDVPVQAGQRYYDYPNGAALGNIIKMYAKWGNIWTPVADDLDPEDYNAFNSDLGVRTDPVQKWRPYNQTQFEVWPMPASNVSTLRFVYKAPFVPLVDESDRCLLDTDLVVLFSAAQVARRNSDKEADLILARAEQHKKTLQLREKGARRKINMASGGEDSPARVGFRDKIIVGVERR